MNGYEQVQDLVNRKVIKLQGKLKLPTCFVNQICVTCENYNGLKCLYMRIFQQYFSTFKCKSCGKNAIMFNPFNNVIQCHNCGARWIDPNETEKIMLT